MFILDNKTFSYRNLKKKKKTTENETKQKKVKYIA